MSFQTQSRVLDLEYEEAKPSVDTLSSLDMSAKERPLHVCLYCGKTLKSRSCLVQHERTHTNEKPFVCPKCGRAFSLQGNLQRHLMSHSSQKKPYPCRQCGIHLRTFYSLVKHQQIHREQRHACTLCKKRFTTATQLKNHMAKHLKEKLICATCNKRFRSRVKLRDHLETHKKQANGVASKSVTKLVSRRPEKQQQLVQKANRSLSRGSRKKTLKSVSSPHVHQLTHARDKGPQRSLASPRGVLVRPPVRVYACGICTNTFETYYRLRKHKQMHKDRPHMCPKCEETFVTSEALVEHNQSSCVESYTCDTCSRAFITEASLDKHKIKHLMERPYMCAICMQAFRTTSELKTHMLSHAGKRSLSCPTCDEAFRKPSHLQRHKEMCQGKGTGPQASTSTAQPSATAPVSVSTGCEDGSQAAGPRFLCSFCGKDQSNASRLEEHERVHSNERPFCCDDCGRAFKRKSTLKLHMRTHRKQTTWKSELSGTGASTAAPIGLAQPPEQVACQSVGEDVKSSETLGGSASSALQLVDSATASLHFSHFLQCESSIPFSDNQSSLHEEVGAQRLNDQIQNILKSLETNNDSTVQKESQDLQKPMTPVTSLEVALTCTLPVINASEASSNDKTLSVGAESKQVPSTEESDSDGDFGQPDGASDIEEFMELTCTEVFSPEAPSASEHQVDLANETELHAPSAQEVDDILNQSIECQKTLKIMINKLQLYTCPLCQRMFSTSEALNEHKTSHGELNECLSVGNTGGGLFSCKHCSKTFADEGAFKEHELIHSKRMSHQCDKCNQGFSGGDMLKIHQISVHNKALESLKCEFCGKLAKSMSLLRLHVMSHSDEYHYKCEWCGRTYKHKCHLTEHQNKCKSKTVGKDTASHIATKIHVRFHCKICKDIFPDKSRLADHELSHTVEKPHKCDKCCKQFSEVDELRIHQIYVHREAVESLKCEFCGKLAKSMFHLRLHVMSHSDEHHHKCEWCGRTYKHRGHLTDHQSRCELRTFTEPTTSHMATKIRFSCKFCKDVFPDQDRLLEHEFSHTVEKPHKCDKCSKQFSDVDELRIHQISVHMAALESLKCEFCGKQARKTSILRIHIASHSKERTYKCSNCFRSYKNKYYLGIHRFRCKSKTEATKESVTCKFCRKVFADQSKLLQHDCLHTGEKQFKCEDCSKAYMKKSQLRNHQKMRHGKVFPGDSQSTFECEVCKKVLMSRSLLTCHMKSHSSERPHKCDICGRVYKHKHHMRIHKANCTGKATGRSSRKHRQRTTVMPERGPAMKTHSCSKCSESFSYARSLRIHEIQAHQTPSPQLKCQVCGKACRSKARLANHMLIHSNEGLFKCDRCSKKFKDDKSLRCHQTACDGKTCERSPSSAEDPSGISGETPRVQLDIQSSADGTELYVKARAPDAYSSVGASQPSQSDDDLAADPVASSSDDDWEPSSSRRKFFCNFCDKSFAQKSKLLKHEQWHTKNRPHKCEECPQTFLRVGSLREHVASVHQTPETECEKIGHKCDQCGKVYKHRHHLIVHKGLHQFEHGPTPVEAASDAEPSGTVDSSEPSTEVASESQDATPKTPAVSTMLVYTCMFCGKVFENQQTFLEHEQTHTEERPFKCTECEASFSYGKALRAHLINYHCKQPSTTQPSTNQPSTTQPSTTQPSTTQPSTTQPSATQPSATQPSATQPSTTQPSATQPSATQPSTTQPSTTQPSATQPSATQPSATQPSTTQPSATQPSATQPSATQPSTTWPSTTRPSTTRPSTTRPSTTRPSTTRSTTKNRPQDSCSNDLFQFKGSKCKHCGRSFQSERSLENHLFKQTCIPAKCEVCDRVFKHKHNLKDHIIARHPESFSLQEGKNLRTASDDSVNPVSAGLVSFDSLVPSVLGSSKRSIYTCRICCKISPSRSKYLLHAIVHTGEKPFKCQQCGERFTAGNPLKRHLIKEHGENFTHRKFSSRNFMESLTAHDPAVIKQGSTNTKHICSICGKSYPTENALLTHSRVHKSDRPFKCDTCGKGYKYKHHLKQHQKQSHRQYDPIQSSEHSQTYDTVKSIACARETNVELLCKICGQSFHHEAGLIEHLQLHSNGKPFTCKVCLQTFQTYLSLQRHLLLLHSDSLLCASFLKCHICDIKFKIPVRYENHMIGQHRLYRTVKAFHRGEWSNHMRDFSRCFLSFPYSNKKYHCTACENTFLTVRRLKKHFIRTHTDILDLKCKSCQRGFSTKEELVQHEATHPKDQTGLHPTTCGERIESSSQGRDNDVIALLEGMLTDSYSTTTAEETKPVTVDESSYHQCGVCSRMCLTQGHLKEHYLRAHTDIRPYRCHFCCERFYKKSSYVQHKKTHEKSRCNSCKNVHFKTAESPLPSIRISESLKVKSGYTRFLDKQTNKKRALTEKQQKQSSVSSPKRFQCIDCAGTFSKMSCFAVHRQLHKAWVLTIYCRHCGKHFETRWALRRHYILTHSETNMAKSEQEEETRECLSCGEAFLDKRSLIDHLAASHSKPLLYPCKHCSAAFPTPLRQRMHGLLAHPKNKLPMLTCTICKDRYQWSYLFRLHSRSHLRSKPKELKCSKCGNIFRTEICLFLHNRCRHDTKQTLMCDICGKLESSISKLEQHKLLHTNRKDYICERCGKRFNRLMSLRKHGKIKCNVKQVFTCETCGVSFPRKSFLSMHVKSHRDKKRKCKYCNKVVRNQGTLTVHLRIHTGEKPYSCSVCKKSFRLRAVLMEHMNTHTGQKPFKCKKCDACFASQGSLHNHQRVHQKKPAVGSRRRKAKRKR